MASKHENGKICRLAPVITSDDMPMGIIECARHQDSRACSNRHLLKIMDPTLAHALAHRH